MSSLMPGAEPYSHDGGVVAALLIHGFTSTPQSMRPWGAYLAEQGYTVRIPRLPGHGTSWREANLTTWTDWFAEVDRAFGLLRRDHEQVFVLGQSMGGTLALRLAEQRPAELAGLVLANPSVHTENKLAPFTGALSRVLPAWSNIAGDTKADGEKELSYSRMPLRAFCSLQQLWGLVRADIAAISAPTLLFHSTVDHVVEPSNTAWLVEHLQVSDFTTVEYDNSYHLLTLDNDAPAMFAASAEFMRRLTG